MQLGEVPPKHHVASRAPGGALVALLAPGEADAALFGFERAIADDLTAVDGVPIEGMTLDEVVAKVKGPRGTEVTLGAKEVSLEWAYPGLTVSFDTRFQFAGDGKLTGMGGSIDPALLAAPWPVLEAHWLSMNR